jgi:hypothetical protein
MTERKDGDRIVITGYSAGSHFPRKQADTQYRLEVDGLSSEGPFHVDGSIYGRDLRFRGGGSVLGPVLGRADITLDNPTNVPQRLFGGVHTSGNVVVRSRGVGLDGLVGAGLQGVRHVVRGDVIAEHVDLESCVVFGNVRARRIRLTGCLVLGQLLATDEIHASASTFLAYESPSIRIEGPTCMLHALGTSMKAPEFGDFVDGAGVRWPAEVMFYPAVVALGGPPVLMHRRVGKDLLRRARLVPSDWVRAPATQIRKKVVGDTIESEEIATERFVLSIAGRALNFSTVEECLGRLSWILRTTLEWDHYHPRIRSRIVDNWRSKTDGDELALLDLAVPPDSAERSPSANRTAAQPAGASLPALPSEPSRPVTLPKPTSAASGDAKSSKDALPPTPTSSAAPAPASASAPSAAEGSPSAGPQSGRAASPATVAMSSSGPASTAKPAAGTHVMSASSTSWKLRAVEGGSVVGPVPSTLVLDGIGAGKIPPQTKVCAEGGDTWTPILEIAEFKSAFDKRANR